MSIIDELRSSIALLKRRVNILEQTGRAEQTDYLDANIFTVRIESNGIKSLTDKDTKVNATYIFEYPDGTAITCTGKVKWQGSGSIRWPDKNYQISGLSQKISFKTYDGAYGNYNLTDLYPMAKTRTWGARKKFVLKRDHMDHTHSRNTIAARLWGDVVSTRAFLLDDLTAKPSDWDANYNKYFRWHPESNAYIKNTDSTFHPVNVFFTTTDNGNVAVDGYYPLTQQPADWDANYNSYYRYSFTSGFILNTYDHFVTYAYNKVADKDVLPKLSSLVNYGAVDAFPCKVYVNGEYYGLYALGIPKDEDLFDMETDGSAEGFVCGEEWGKGVQFNTPAYYSEPFTFEDGDVAVITQEDYEKYLDDGTIPTKAFVVEYNDENCDWMPGSLNALLDIVYDSTTYPNGDTFRTALEECLDVKSAIDYLLFVRALCMPDNYARNMILATYDGTYWFCSAYDMDTAFGIHWSGEAFHSVTTYASVDSSSYTNSTMRLWKRLIDNYPNEIKARWNELRGYNGALSTANVIDKIYGYWKELPDNLYVKDTGVYNKLFKTATYPYVPSSGSSNMLQLISWYQEHSKLLDESISHLGS